MSFNLPPPVTLAIAAASAAKADGTATTPYTFTVTRSGSTTAAASATWTVTGFGANPATAADFVGGKLPTGTVSFGAGQTTQTITVNVVGGLKLAYDQGFTVTLSAPSGAGIGTASASGSILAPPATYTLTAAPVTIAAGGSNDSFIATNGTLNSRDHLNGGGGTNTLQLSGGGFFDLGAPAQLVNIQLLIASEGQAPTTTGSTDTRQTVYLRDGLNLTVNVTSGTPAAGNSNPETITLYGGANSDIINLGKGTDSVVLGSATETVNGGGGTALVQATAAQAGALVKGAATASTTLEITTGGTATLNAGTTYATVKLDAVTVLTLNKPGFITASGTIATLNGGTIKQFASNDKIDIADLIYNATTKPTLGYIGSTLTLTEGSTKVNISLPGSFTAGKFVTAGDNHGGTLITYAS